MTDARLAEIREELANPTAEVVWAADAAYLRARVETLEQALEEVLDALQFEGEASHYNDCFDHCYARARAALKGGQ